MFPLYTLTLLIIPSVYFSQFVTLKGNVDEHNYVQFSAEILSIDIFRLLILLSVKQRKKHRKNLATALYLFSV